MILVFAVVMTGAMWLEWNTGPTMPEPDPSAYVPLLQRACGYVLPRQGPAGQMPAQ